MPLGKTTKKRSKKRQKRPNTKLNDYQGVKDATESIKEIKQSTLDILPWKRISTHKSQFIELRTGGFMQMLAIQGSDYESMSYVEQKRLLQNFAGFLATTFPGMTIYTTQLPTDTAANVDYLDGILAEIREEKETVRTQRQYDQKLAREELLKEKQHIQKQIERELLNVEYLLLLFAETEKELTEITQKALYSSYSRESLKLQHLSYIKKVHALTEFNNMNTKLT